MYVLGKYGLLLSKVQVTFSTENVRLDIFTSIGSRFSAEKVCNFLEQKSFSDDPTGLNLTQLAKIISFLYSFDQEKISINFYIEFFGNSSRNSSVKNIRVNDKVRILFRDTGHMSSDLIARYIMQQLECPKGLRDNVFNRGFTKRSLAALCTRISEKCSGLLGLRVELRGRWTGADRTQIVSSKVGVIKSQTINAPVDFSTVSAKTIYGLCGIRVWVHHQK